MAGQFDLPSWLTTQDPWSGSDAFIKGSAAGAAIAANRIRAKQLYADVRQTQQRIDIAEREQITREEASNLHNELLRTKMANDAADFEALRQWYPEFMKSDGDIAPPTLYNENAMLKVSSEIAAKRSKVGMAAFAEFMAKPGRDLTRPEDQVEYYDLLAKYKNIPDKLGPDGIMAPIRVAENLKRQRDEADSRINERDRRAALAKEVGWVYPEDGSPPYLMDAKGGTHFAPFHAGLEAGFTPSETTIGDVRLIHTSPNKWQVVERPIPAGKLTDLEKEDLRYVRKRRQELVDSLDEVAPKPGFFGGNKDKVDKYNKTTKEIADLTTREEALHKAVESRGTDSKVTREGLKTAEPPVAEPTVIAPDNSARAAEIRAAFLASKQTKEDKEEAMRKLRELGFK